ncbi:MAG: ATP-binding protein [Anaerolineales bacterium]
MTQLVVLSGKGGTGKTSLTAALAHLASLEGADLRPVLVDADVDAANLELLLETHRVQAEDFQGGAVALIDQDRCSTCGRCGEVCRFSAVDQVSGAYEIDPIACDGCAACLYECPEGAIQMEDQQAGEWYISDTNYGRLFHAHLFPARENSGKLVAHIKRRAQESLEELTAGWMIVDGPPGIGCPVISAVSGADAVLAVTEPSLSGIHDLERLLRTVDYFDVPAYVTINKADIYPQGTDNIKDLCRERGAVVLGEIPYDLDIPRSMAAGLPVTAFQPESQAARAVMEIWKRISQLIGGKGTARQLIEL